eukprot:358969-Chlamydomonas_euryale.AAC.4
MTPSAAAGSKVCEGLRTYQGAPSKGCTLPAPAKNQLHTSPPSRPSRFRVRSRLTTCITPIGFQLHGHANSGRIWGYSGMAWLLAAELPCFTHFKLSSGKG